MKSNIKLFPLFILIPLLFFSCTFKKGIGDYINKEALYVSANGNDGNDGTLYTPVRTIEEGLKKLRKEGYKTLKVSKGVYIERGPIVIDASVTIDGGWKEDFSGKTSLLVESDYSIISGNHLLTNLITISNASDVELKGLLLCDTVREAAVSLDDSSIVIRRSREIRLNSLIFQNNLANRGGALFIDRSSRIFIDRSSFINNEAELEGGAVVTDNSHFLYFTNNSFRNNYAKSRGGSFFANISSRVYFDEGEFIGNRTEITGGGLSFAGSSNIRLADLLFQENRALHLAGKGGAIEVTEARDFNIKNNSFLENEAYSGSDISLVLVNDDLTRAIRENKFNYTSRSSITVHNSFSGPMTRFTIENNRFKLLDSTIPEAYAFVEDNSSGFNLQGHTFKLNKFENYAGKEVYRNYSSTPTINSTAAINEAFNTDALTSDNVVVN